MKPSTLEERTKHLELEAALQRQTLRASVETLRSASLVTWGLAGASLVGKVAVVNKAKWFGYALILGRVLLDRRRTRRQLDKLSKLADKS